MDTKKILILLLLSGCLAAFTRYSPVQSTAARKLNVIFIMADDLGWKDAGFMGSTFYETPNLDALAKKGMVFTNAYAANPLCSPTRASIMTGQYPARIGITSADCHLPEEILTKGLDTAANAAKWIPAQSLSRLKTDYHTLAEAMKDAGYRTGHFGKWHLGKAPYHPLNQGFDVDFPQWSWAAYPARYLAPWKVGVSPLSDKGTVGEYIEDRTADEAIDFIRQNKNQPFFLNYWMWSVHGPHEGKEPLIRKYAAKADPANPQRHPVYGAMVETMDANVGKILKAVQEQGLDENTIVIFCSDNGGYHWQSRQIKNNTNVTSNLPLRGGKATIYEGGTRVPCIVKWPGRTKSGAVSTELISSIDWYPTLLELVGGKVAIAKFDGISIRPALMGKPLPRNALFCHFPHGDPTNEIGAGHQPSTSVRQGDWKLIRFYCDAPDQSDRFELYNLKNDPGEMNNLVATYPTKVTGMKPLIDRFLRDTEAVIPVKNPGYAKR